MLPVDPQKSEDSLRQVLDTLPTLVWCTRPQVEINVECLSVEFHIVLLL